MTVPRRIVVSMAAVLAWAGAAGRTASRAFSVRRSQRVEVHHDQGCQHRYRLAAGGRGFSTTRRSEVSPVRTTARCDVGRRRGCARMPLGRRSRSAELVTETGHQAEPSIAVYQMDLG